MSHNWWTNKSGKGNCTLNATCPPFADLVVDKKKSLPFCEECGEAFKVMRDLRRKKELSRDMARWKAPTIYYVKDLGGSFVKSFSMRTAVYCEECGHTLYWTNKYSRRQEIL